MNPFGDERAAIAGKLTAAGIPATVDPAAGVPCVLVAPFDRGGRARSGIGSWPGVIPVRVLAAPPGGLEALTWLETTLTDVCRVLGWPVDGPTAGISVHAGRDCPSYTLTYPAELPNPDC